MIQITLNGADQSTGNIRPSKPKVGVESGHIALSLSGTWTATVHVQRSFDGGSSWLDVEPFTNNIETDISDLTTNADVLYRVTIKSGNYTSGSVNVILAN